MTSRSRALRSIVALIVLWIGVVFDWYWIWGLLFLYWTVPAFFTGKVFLLDEIDQDENPFTFWSIVVSWILLSVLSVAWDGYRLATWLGVL